MTCFWRSKDVSKPQLSSVMGMVVAGLIGRARERLGCAHYTLLSGILCKLERGRGETLSLPLNFWSRAHCALSHWANIIVLSIPLHYGGPI